MWKQSAKQWVKKFSPTNQKWQPSANLNDSTKICLLGVAEKRRKRGFISRILNRKESLVHGTTFQDVSENEGACNFELSLKEDVVGELDTAVSMKLEGSVKAEVAKVFQTSIEGSHTVTAENDFGELFIKTIGEYDMVQFFEEYSVQLTSPLISQLLEKKKKIFVVTGIGSIQGDSTLTYKVDQDSRVAASHSSASADVSVTGEKESARGEKLYVPDGAVIMYRLTRVEINKQTGEVIPVLTEDKVPRWYCFG